VTRRRFLLQGAAGALALSSGWPLPSRAQTMTPLESQLSDWEAFGWHWTGSPAQKASAEWLAQSASSAGLRCEVQTFDVDVLSVATCVVQDEHHAAVGLPLLNHAATPSSGLSGKLALPPAEGEIALLALPPQAHVEQAIATNLTAKSGAAYSGFVIVTTGAAPGLAPLDVLAKPMPLPVVQVSSDALSWLSAAADRNATVTMVADFARDSGTGQNVIAIKRGLDINATPMVVATSISGWGPCVGERGGDAAVWLQVAAALAESPPQRGVVMVALSGDELGGVGRDAFNHRFADLAPHAIGWLELGANLGARYSTVQIEADESPLGEILARRVTLEGVRFERRKSSPDNAPERVVTRVGIKASPAPLFHLPGDRLPGAVDLRALGSIGAACAKTVVEFAQT
jgi:hypothetical protein